MGRIWLAVSGIGTSSCSNKLFCIPVLEEEESKMILTKCKKHIVIVWQYYKLISTNFHCLNQWFLTWVRSNPRGSLESVAGVRQRSRILKLFSTIPFLAEMVKPFIHKQKHILSLLTFITVRQIPYYLDKSERLNVVISKQNCIFL